MCIGIPMQVTALHGDVATCECDGYQPETVDTRLVETVAIGDWLLVYKGAAREWLSPERAEQITLAIQALAAIQRGEDFEPYFADLIGREPELPPHLRKS